MEKLKDSETLREEKKAVGEDARKSTMLERIELLKMGQLVREAPDYALLSPIMSENYQKEQLLAQELQMQQEDESLRQDDVAQGARGMTEASQGPPQGVPLPEQGVSNDGGVVAGPEGGVNQPSGGPPV